MGFYTDLPERDLGRQISMDEALNLDANTAGIIVLIVNPTFTAKGWAFSNLELRRFTMLTDLRIKRFFHMPTRAAAMLACGLSEDPLDDPEMKYHLQPLASK